MRKRVIWTAICAAAPWFALTFIISIGKLTFYGPASWDEAIRTVAAAFTLILAVACWTYPGWDWDK